MATPWAGAQLGTDGTLTGWAWNTSRLVAPKTHEWWDGTTYQPASLLGWWDGVTVQGCVLLGWWDGTQVQPVGVPS